MGRSLLRLRESHPTWVRGLKHNVVEAARYALGRTLHGCVD